MCWRAVTERVEDLVPDVLRGVIRHFQNSPPEVGDVGLDAARTHLAESLLPHLRVLVLRQLHDDVNVSGGRAQTQGFLPVQVTHAGNDEMYDSGKCQRSCQKF